MKQFYRVTTTRNIKPFHRTTTHTSDYISTDSVPSTVEYETISVDDAVYNSLVKAHHFADSEYDEFWITAKGCESHYLVPTADLELALLQLAAEKRDPDGYQELAELHRVHYFCQNGKRSFEDFFVA